MIKVYTLQDILDIENEGLEQNTRLSKYLNEGWTGTAIDILSLEACPVEDRLWTVLRREFLTERQLRLFSIWCAREELAMFKKQEDVFDSSFSKLEIQKILEISLNTCDVAEKYVNGEATQKEFYQATEKERIAAYTPPEYISGSIFPESRSLKLFFDSMWFGRSHFSNVFFMNNQKPFWDKSKIEPFYDANKMIATAVRFASNFVYGFPYPTEESKAVEITLRKAQIAKVKEYLS